MRLKGVIKSKNPARSVAGGKTIHDFLLKTADGKELKCSKFDAFNNDLIGEWVSFNAKENEYKGKISFTVQGEIVLTDAEEVKVEPEVDSGDTMLPASVQSLVAVQPSREDFRVKAEEAVVKNIESARVIIKNLELGTKVDILQLADMVGRTMTAIALDNKKGY